MGTFLDPNDLDPFATIDPLKADAMIEDAEAMAVLVAPCIAAAGFAHAAALKAILRGAILRWNDSGTGAIQAQTAGPFGQTLDTRQERKAMFWPSEIEQLQNLCSDLGGGLYTTSLAGPDPSTSTTMSDQWVWSWPY
jgi:hypothetical protein